MRASLLVLSPLLLAAACAAPPTPTPALAPAPAPALALTPTPTPAPAPAPTQPLSVLQVIPPVSVLQWGGAGHTLAVTGRSCETSLVDTEVGRVTARVAACWVWPSPARDAFLAHMDDGSLVLWERDGTHGPALSSKPPPRAEVASAPGRPSPDGAWAASESTIGGATWLDVVDLATRKRVLHRRDVSDPRWSADSGYLAVRTDEKTPRLVVFAAGRWEEVWSRRGVEQDTWSPAGARLAVAGAESGLAIFDASTASTRPLPSATTAWFERLYQAPDGALMAPMVPRLSGADAPGHAVRVEPDGAAAVVDVPTGARDPGWSPDGSRVVVRTIDMPNMMSTSWRLFVADTKTKERAFVDHGYGGVGMWWSSRAHRLLVMRGEGLLFDADTHRVWNVPVKGSWTAAIDADGTRAAMETPEGLEVVPLASKERPTLLSPPSDPPPALLALSGSRLAAVTRDGEVRVWNVESGEQVAAWKAGFAPEHVAWLGEGKRLALSRHEVLRLSEADGSQAVTLTALTSPNGTSLFSGSP